MAAFRLQDFYGTAAAGGSVRFYQPGTGTQVNVYTNDTLTTVATQPVALDATGRLTIDIYASAFARAVVFDANGAQLQDITRVDGHRAELVTVANANWPAESTADAVLTALATSIGGLDGKFLTSATGGLSRNVREKLSDEVHVKDFGAKGDGSTDDAAAFNTALSWIALASTGGGVVRFGPGTYAIASPILITSAGATLRGTGATTALIKNLSTTANAITVSNVAGVTMEDFGVTAGTTSSGIAIQQQGTGHRYSRLSLALHHKGISKLDGIAIAVDVPSNDAAGGALSFEMADAGKATLLLCTSSSVVAGCAWTAGAASQLVVIGGSYASDPNLQAALSGSNQTLVAGVTFTAAGPNIRNGSNVRLLANNYTGVLSDASKPYKQTNSVSTTALTLDFTQYRIQKVVSTGTISTLLSAAVACRGHRMWEEPCYLQMVSSSGTGTFQFDAVTMFTNGNPTVAAGQTMTMTFIWDADTSVFKEIARQTVVAV